MKRTVIIYHFDLNISPVSPHEIMYYLQACVYVDKIMWMYHRNFKSFYELSIRQFGVTRNGKIVIGRFKLVKSHEIKILFISDS